MLLSSGLGDEMRPSEPRFSGPASARGHPSSDIADGVEGFRADAVVQDPTDSLQLQRFLRARNGAIQRPEERLRARLRSDIRHAVLAGDRRGGAASWPASAIPPPSSMTSMPPSAALSTTSASALWTQLSTSQVSVQPF